MPQVDIIQLLKQDGGEKFYPVTHIDAVIGWKDASFFEKVDNGNGGISIKLKSEYEGLWADGWIASGGVGSGSGGGGGVSFLKDLTDIYHDENGILRADGTTHALSGDALVYDSTLALWLAAEQSGGGGSALSLSREFVYLYDANGDYLRDINGNYLVENSVGYKINLLDGNGGVLSTISLTEALMGYVPTSRKINGHQLSSDITLSAIEDFGVAEWAIGGSGSTVPFDRLPELFVAGTKVMDSAAPRALLGVSSISYDLSSTGAETSLISWEPNAGGPGIGAWHIFGNLYADGWIASGGTGSGSVSIVGIDDLSDVSLSSPSNGQALIYRSGAWTNETISSGGSTVAVENLASTSAQISRIAKITVDGTDTYLFNDVAWGTYDSTSKTVSVTINGTTRTLCVDGYNSGGGGGGSISAATSSSLGGIKIGYTQNNKNYPVELDSNDRAYVSVPWEGGSGGGGGTVTSVGISVPSFMSVTNSPVTSSGTISLSFSSQAKNKVLASPISASGAPTFRVLDTADIPDLSGTYVTLSGSTQTITGAKIFTTNPVTIGSSSGLSVDASSYIDIGDARLVYDSDAKALHITKKSVGLDPIGLYADGFVASGGVGTGGGLDDTVTQNSAYPVKSSGIYTFVTQRRWVGTQAQYDALALYDSDVEYLITES